MAQAQAETGATLKALTVLDRRADPYRLDTPVNHRDARWLARWIDELVPSGQVHLRGLHYLLAMIHRPRKPNGKRYANTTADWEWMSETAAKAARWLGYVEFDRIKDQRNATPTIIEAAEPQQPQPVVYTGIAAEIPEIGDLRPSPIMYRDDPQQPYRIAIVGEKSSLAEIVTPEAERLGADVFLPTGDISDTLVYQLARAAAEDGRPLVVLYLADCDPAGWHMGVVIARKLQALADLHFPSLAFEVRRVALTPDQVREHGLPSAPLKESEKRADRWLELMGVEQTEIDALVALRPDLLVSLLRDAAAPFFDETLAGRADEAEARWRIAAQTRIDAALDEDELASLQERAEQAVAELHAVDDELDELVSGDVDLGGFDQPTPVIASEPASPPLVSSAWSWVKQTARLVASRDYDER